MLSLHSCMMLGCGKRYEAVLSMPTLTDAIPAFAVLDKPVPPDTLHRQTLVDFHSCIDKILIQALGDEENCQHMQPDRPVEDHEEMEKCGGDVIETRRNEDSTLAHYVETILHGTSTLK